jgi:molecular chaperone Hsp33
MDGRLELRDELVRTMTPDGSASVRVLSATNLVREAARRHSTSPMATVILGRALMGGLLLATEGQDGEHVQLQLRGQGPIGTITVTADSEGAVRGYVQHPQIELPLRGDHFDTAEAIGLGELSVDRNHPSWKRPYGGIVPIVSGEIAKDLALYLMESEQKPSTVVLGIFFSSTGEIEAAGGYLIQSLPGADDEALAGLEQRVIDTSNPSQLLHDGASADQILERLLGGPPSSPVDRVYPRFHCPCSVERIRSAASLLGRKEIHEIIEQGEDLEVCCAFCADIYRLAPDELGGIFPDA